jgi:hypothetical protein
VEPEKVAAARQWLCEHVSAATKSRERSNGYTDNNIGTAGSGFFYIEESTVLGVVTKQRLVETQQTEKNERVL